MEYRVNTCFRWKGKSVSNLTKLLCDLEGPVKPGGKLQAFPDSQRFMTVRLKPQVYPIPNLKISFSMVFIVLGCISFLGYLQIMFKCF